MTILPSESRMSFAAREREIEQVADADGQRNQAKGSGGPGFRFVHNTSDQTERGHKTDGPADEKNGVLAGTRRGSDRFFERNRNATSDGRHALVGLQFFHAKKGVHRRHGNSKGKNHGR